MFFTDYRTRRSIYEAQAQAVQAAAAATSALMPALAGTIGLVRGGNPELDVLCRVAQFLNRDGFEDYEHAFVLLPGRKILEAGSPASRIRPYPYKPGEVYWCTSIRSLLPPAVTSRDFLLTHMGEQLTGIPYGFADYGALVAHRFGLDFIPAVRDQMASDKSMICSQLADEYYLRLRAHVFTDNRLPGAVTPGSLYRRDQALRKNLGNPG